MSAPAHLSSASATPATVVPLMLATTTLGLALLDRDGTLSLPALVLLSLALIESWIAVLVRPEAPVRFERWIAPLMLAVQISSLMFVSALATLPRTAYVVHAALVVSIALTTATMIRADRPQRRRLLFLLAILTAIVGVNLLTALPRPGIDVLLFQRESLDHLLRGTNPYTVEFQDPYSPSASALFYGPGVSVNGILQFGYPYMPLTLLSALPGHLLGDVRYASLGAMIGAALLIAFARENRTSSIGAALLLTTPAFPVMLLMGWVEAHVVVLVAATWYASCRAPRFLPYATGLLFASKQYTIVILPALMLLANGGSPPFSVVAFMTRAIIAGGVVTLPLVLWDVDAFLRSAVWLQIKQPFRRDALSFLTALFPAHLGQWIVLPFAMTAGVWVTILRLRAAVTFPLAIGLAFFVFFAFNKQAFLNYYYLVIGCLCCAIAAGDARETSVDEPATAVR